MKSAWALLLGIFVSLLPSRYRGSHDLAEFTGLKNPATVSGLMQILGFFVLHIYHLLYVYRSSVQRVAEQVLESGKDIDMSLQHFSAGLGALGFLEYMINPVSMLLTYFLFEGMVRFIAALSAGQIVATLPLALIAGVHNRLDKAGEDKALGERTVDIVKKGDGNEFDLCIFSSRPKLTWDKMMTISFQDQLYEMAEHREGPPPRRFVYLLRKMPGGKVVRGLHPYRPDENLRGKSK